MSNAKGAVESPFLEHADSNEDNFHDSVNNIPGEDDSDGEEEEDYQSVLACRKKLIVTFDKHATDEAKTLQKGNDTLKVNTKPPMIPNPNNSLHDQDLKKAHKRSSTSSVASLNSHASSQSSCSMNSAVNNKRLLSVFLRIRPPPLNTSSDDVKEESTMEVITEDASKVLDDNASLPQHHTVVRTYAPVSSQAYKSIRQTNDNANDGGVVMNGAKEYKFNRVFGPSASQVDVYDEVAAPLVEGLFPSNGTEQTEGKSALIFSYGMTNAGKTYTVIGESSTGDDKKSGILPRTLRHILNKIKQRESLHRKYELRMGFFEIYNDNVYDLCAIDTSTKSSQQNLPHHPQQNRTKKSLRLREDKDGHIFVQGLSNHFVDSVSRGVELASIAKSRRQTSSNNLNCDSSRSHCIYQLEVSCISSSPASTSSDNSLGEADSKQNVPPVCMWIVDLAGSERAKRTGIMHKSKRQREAVQINASLMNLMRCLHQLHSNNQQTAGPVRTTRSNGGVVPFRESKLSHLFMNHLLGSSAGHTVMIVNVNPAVADFDETQHVLSYATVARNVRISATEYRKKINEKSPTHTKSKEDKKMGDKGIEKKRLNKRTRDKSPSRKISKLAATLSPRALAKKRTKRETTKKTATESARASSVAGSKKQGNTKPKKQTTAVQRGSTLCLPGGKREKLREKMVEKENENLRNIVDKMRKEVTMLRTESVWLKEELAQKESEIRMEVAEEMEEQMEKMRTQYEDARKQQQKKTVPTPARSAKKIQLDKAEEMMDDLLDKLDECEEEMSRMREIHEEEVKKIRMLHEGTLQAKEKEIQSLLQVHKEAMKAKDEELQNMQIERDSVRQRLSLADEENDCSEIDDENEDAELLDEQSDPDNDGQSSNNSDAESLDDCDDEEAKLKEDELCSSTSATRVRRLPRKRCSEVACATASPTKIEITSPNPSTSKKLKRALRSNQNRDVDRLPLLSVENTL